MENMNISVTPELKCFVEDVVETGRYQSNSEVIRAGLRLLEEQEVLYQEKLLALQSAIDEGVNSEDDGELDMKKIISICHKQKNDQED